MTIPFTPEIEQLVQGIYAGGAYASQADVVTTALRLLEQRDRLRKLVHQGCEELDRGERLDSDAVFSELHERATELNGRHE